jgi:hypothetical protein
MFCKRKFNNKNRAFYFEKTDQTVNFVAPLSCRYIDCFISAKSGKMSYEIVLSRNGCKQALQVAADTLKNLKVWKVAFPDGEEAVLFKCGTEWFQRNDDGLSHDLLKAIGQKIDHILLGIALS